jgi:hypothetical protein
MGAKNVSKKESGEQANEVPTIDPGKPLQELVKGSREYTLQTIARSFYQQYTQSEESDTYLWIVDTFADYVVVRSNDLPPAHYYKVGYTFVDEHTVEFDSADDWEVVQLSYTPSDVQLPIVEGSGEGVEVVPLEAATESQDSRTAKDGRKWVERESDARIALEEAEKGKPRMIHATVAEADVINLNHRRYQRDVLDEAVKEAKTHLHESLSQGRAILLGEAEHPSDKGQRPRFLDTIIKWVDIWFERSSGLVKARGEMLATEEGRDAIILMDAGVMPGVSLRGYGESEIVEEDGQEIEEVQWFRFTGIDLVLEPGFQEAAVTLLESKQEVAKEKMDEETPVMEEQIDSIAPTVVDVSTVREEIRGQFENELAVAREQGQAAANDLNDLLASLEVENLEDARALIAQQRKAAEEAARLQREREIAGFIESACNDVDYPKALREQFQEFIGQPQTLEEAEDAVTRARKLFDKLAADARLRGMGMRVNGDVEVTGPVIETETGVPEYTRVAQGITEAMIKAEKAQPRNLAEGMTRAERYTRKYLERFDEVYRPHLIEESRRWQEAELSTHLSLPYSVLRAVVAEAFPQLVAASIFDMAPIDQSPIRIWYQASYVGEAGSTGSITDESVTAIVASGDPETSWVGLAHGRLNFGTVVLTSDPAGTTYVEGTDYVIDYAAGKLLCLDAGSIANGAALLIDYTYNAFREGENVGIERARATLAYQTLETAADRLATEVTSEAVVFSRSQLGWDATTQTIALLIKEVMKRIDANLFHNALSAALRVASNSGGTWNVSGTDTVADLLKLIGTAKTNIMNRYFEPTFILASVTNAEKIANDTIFAAQNQRPDTLINEAGFVRRVSGLPLFSSTEFPDGYLLVGNRELVMHRVFQPMQLEGPFQTFDSNRKLVASKQYYIEEYNGNISPEPGKGSYVVVT